MQRAGGNIRVWVLNALIAGAAGAGVFLLRHGTPHDDTIHLSWWALAPMFFLTEIFVINIPFRRETQSFSLSEIPIVLGLFFATPHELIFGQVIGAGVALIAHRKQPVVKWSFNIAHLALEAVVASAVFRAIAERADVLDMHEIAATFLATVGAIVLGVAAVVSAIGLSEGRPNASVFARVLALGSIGAATNTSIVLMAVVFLRLDPTAVWLLAVPTATLFIAYRGYASYRDQLVTLNKLYEATRDMQRSRWMEPALKSLLESARTIFHAEHASLLLLPDQRGERAVEYTIGADGEMRTVGVIALDPMQGVWARVTGDRSGVLLARPIREEHLRTYFGARGLRDAIVAPFFGEGDVAGTLTVANKLSDIETFTDEELTLLETLSNHASLAIDNAKLASEQKSSIGGLEDLHRLKDEFLATVSHELRTPLMSITGFIELMRDHGVPPDQRAHYLDVMHRQSVHLRALIEDLLMSARLDAAGLRVEPVRVEPSRLLQRIAEAFASWNPADRIVVIIDDELPVIDTDEDALRRIVTNLVQNALKHSEDDSTVTVRARADKGGIYVSVEDQGAGIPPAMHDRIFERFVQVDGSPLRKASGAGLGLYICRGLAEAIGGRVWLERSQPGAGSRFAVWVPSSIPGDVVQMPRRISLDRAEA